MSRNLIRWTSWSLVAMLLIASSVAIAGNRPTTPCEQYGEYVADFYMGEYIDAEVEPNAVGFHKAFIESACALFEDGEPPQAAVDALNDALNATMETTQFVQFATFDDDYLQRWEKMKDTFVFELTSLSKEEGSEQTYLFITDASNWRLYCAEKVTWEKEAFDSFIYGFDFCFPLDAQSIGAETWEYLPLGIVISSAIVTPIAPDALIPDKP